jgi:hypothetical protein
MTVRIGDCGKATSRLQPHGFIEIGGERYDARSEFGPIDPGTEVVVVAGDHLGLVVRRAEPGAPPVLPEHGQPVCTSFGERVSAEAGRAEADRQAWLDDHRRFGMTTAALAGAVVAAVAVWLLWGYVGERAGDPWAVAAAVVLAGAAAGVGAFRGLDEVLGEVGGHFRRASTPAACLAVLGAGGGAVLALPAVGLTTGLAIALAAAVVLAGIPPLFVLLTGGGAE